MNWTLNNLSPFGIEVIASVPREDIRQADAQLIRSLALENRVAVFRGFGPVVGEEFPGFCSSFGAVLEFDFGVVNQLTPLTDAKNYLYTNGEVPFHWDGAFMGRVPSFIFFHCDEAPRLGVGGETLFADTTRILDSAPNATIDVWQNVEITYTTERVVHYGGSFTARMIADHPATGEKTLRFAEPVTDLNPVHLEVKKPIGLDSKALIEDMHERLHDPGVCYRHEWRNGDLVIADNHALLHGRRAFEVGIPRSIRRVNIL